MAYCILEKLAQLIVNNKCSGLTNGFKLRPLKSVNPGDNLFIYLLKLNYIEDQNNIK